MNKRNELRAKLQARHQQSGQHIPKAKRAAVENAVVATAPKRPKLSKRYFPPSAAVPGKVEVAASSSSSNASLHFSAAAARPHPHSYSAARLGATAAGGFQMQHRQAARSTNWPSSKTMANYELQQTGQATGCAMGGKKEETMAGAEVISEKPLKDCGNSNGASGSAAAGNNSSAAAASAAQQQQSLEAFRQQLQVELNALAALKETEDEQRQKGLASMDEHEVSSALLGLTPTKAFELLQSFGLSTLAFTKLVDRVLTSFSGNDFASIANASSAKATIPFVRAYQLRGATGVDKFLDQLMGLAGQQPSNQHLMEVDRKSAFIPFKNAPPSLFGTSSAAKTAIGATIDVIIPSLPLKKSVLESAKNISSSDELTAESKEEEEGLIADADEVSNGDDDKNDGNNEQKEQQQQQLSNLDLLDADLLLRRLCCPEGNGQDLADPTTTASPNQLLQTYCAIRPDILDPLAHNFSDQVRTLFSSRLPAVTKPLLSHIVHHSSALIVQRVVREHLLREFNNRLNPASVINFVASVCSPVSGIYVNLDESMVSVLLLYVIEELLREKQQKYFSLCGHIDHSQQEDAPPVPDCLQKFLDIVAFVQGQQQNEGNDQYSDGIGTWIGMENNNINIGNGNGNGSNKRRPGRRAKGIVQTLQSRFEQLQYTAGENHPAAGKGAAGGGIKTDPLVARTMRMQLVEKEGEMDQSDWDMRVREAEELLARHFADRFPCAGFDDTTISIVDGVQQKELADVDRTLACTIAEVFELIGTRLMGRDQATTTTTKTNEQVDDEQQQQNKPLSTSNAYVETAIAKAENLGLACKRNPTLIARQMPLLATKIQDLVQNLSGREVRGLPAVPLLLYSLDLILDTLGHPSCHVQSSMVALQSILLLFKNRKNRSLAFLVEKALLALVKFIKGNGVDRSRELLAENGSMLKEMLDRQQHGIPQTDRDILRRALATTAAAVAAAN